MHNSPSWQSTLQNAVEPLDRGVSNLDVNGWRPAGREHLRPHRTAAVLVGITEQAEPGVILTLRSRQLARHAGQVAFPGGSADPGDLTAVGTALREAEEEIGLHPSRVQPLGFLDRIDTISDFRVLPVVGLVHGEDALIADGTEVSEVFEVPLSLVLDLDAYLPKRVSRNGQSTTIHTLQWEGHRVWGVTAAILRNLALRAGATIVNAGE